jgi:glycosidase
MLIPQMKKVFFLIFTIHCLWLNSCQTTNQTETAMQTDMNDESLLKEEVQDHKLVIYQMFTRLFGNTNTTNKVYGTIEENGVGKFRDISPKALDELKKMGITHVWYTGVIEHATMTDYTRYKIPLDDADVIKGRAGSPYAIKDYYDINPDLAADVSNRMKEFEALVQRTHAAGLKVIIDFVPNHVARSYRSDAKPAGVKDLGENDDTSKSFVASNNFYYLPGTSFEVPQDYKPLGNLPHPTKDGKFNEKPAKVTGNDQFTHAPGINEWFETIKLNYGVDIQNNRTTHFEPVPSTWEKMREILQFWAGKGVDGFRCDMAEMVPVEFWSWVIPKVKEVNKDVFFIAEIYNPAQYRNYIEQGKFAYLYDKVGLYDSLKAVMQNRAPASDLPVNWKQLQGINNNMLRFLENHDEQRIASEGFAGDARKGIPAMVVSATLNSGPVMVYFGQEVGEPGKGSEGFGGEDGRTTIFDYWGVPEHQKWLNGGKFDGALLSSEQKQLRDFYSKLLNLSTGNEAIRQGKLYDLQAANSQNDQYDASKVYAYVRFTDKQRVLVVVNFDVGQSKQISLRIPANALAAMNLAADKTYQLTDALLTSQTATFKGSEASETGIRITIEPLGAHIFNLQEK